MDDHTGTFKPWDPSQEGLHIWGLGTFAKGKIVNRGGKGPRCGKCFAGIVVTHMSGFQFVEGVHSLIVASGYNPMYVNPNNQRFEEQLDKARDGHAVVWTRDGLEARCMTLLMGKED